jgi:hypothetical protein
MPSACKNEMAAPQGRNPLAKFSHPERLWVPFGVLGVRQISGNNGVSDKLLHV